MVDSVIEVPLSRGLIALIAGADAESIMRYKWCAQIRNGQFYAGRRANRTIVLMHRQLMGLVPGDGLEVDHINGNKLDNRRTNLRVCRRQQNCCNQLKQTKQTTSKFKGVYWSKERGKWHAQITYNQKRMALGRYASEVEAALAYNRAAERLFGEFARLNIV